MAQKKLLHLFLAVFAAVNGNASALAQTDESKILMETALVLAMRRPCEQMVEKIVSFESFTAIAEVSPVQKGPVCTCVEAKFLADQRLARYWGRSNQAQKADFSSDNLKTYMAVRYVVSAFECLAVEVNVSMDNFTLPP